MKQFIDIHTHILPGVDDGASDRSDSLRMLQEAFLSGTKDIILTPHYHPVKHCIDLKLQRAAYRDLKDYLGENTGFRIYDGNEIYYSHSTRDLLDSGDLATLAGSRYVLLEFSIGAEYTYIEHAVRALQMAGYWCVIAHVERYFSLGDPKRVEDLVKRGAFIQVNSNSIGKIFDIRNSKYIKRLLENELIHFIASDAHDMKNRTPNMVACYEWLRKHYDEIYATQLMYGNSVYILHNERL